MMKILIAVDGSEPALRAIDAVANLARSGLDLSVVLVNVSPSPALYGEMTPTAFDQLNTAIHQEQARILGEAGAQAEAANLVVVSRLGSVGMVASEIVRAADKEGVDQIALGTRGMGAMASFFLGSVAQRVVNMSPVPVLLVE
jgi:nucleotide-binding universal stress UspA family protein